MGTIRYYQRRGLLEEPAKLQAGHRRYPKDMVKRLHFVKRAQALGFTLSEVSELLRLDGARGCAQTRALATRKLTSIEQKISDLCAMTAALAGLVRQCDAGEGGAACPIIGVLARD